MERLLSLELIRVTEAAAIASARLMGRGDTHGRRPRRRGGDAARHRRDPDRRHRSSSARASATRPPCSTSASGSAIRERRRRGPEIDIAVDPLEGTNLVAHGQAGAITVLAAAERAGSSTPPTCYMRKLCVGPGWPGRVESPRRRREPAPDRRGAGPRRQRHHGRDPGAAAPRGAHRRGPRGRRADQADQRRRPLGGDLRARSRAPASTP